MKNILSDWKEKFIKATDVEENAEDFDYDEDDYDYEDSEPQNEEPAAEYKPRANYDFDLNSNYQKSNSFGEYDYEQKKTSAEAPYKQGKFTKKQGTNIYQMNSNAAPVKVSRVVYFYLEDRDDAINVADCMIAQDAVVLLDMSKLNREDAASVLNFLDGIKYVYKSNTEPVGTNVYLIVPGSIELAGDFYGQVSPGIFY